MNNLYFKVNRPEIPGLIGPNESGKTPVMSLISGVQQLTSKWNKIEHRMFCHITWNLRGEELNEDKKN